MSHIEWKDGVSCDIINVTCDEGFILPMTEAFPLNESIQYNTTYETECLVNSSWSVITECTGMYLNTV